MSTKPLKILLADDDFDDCIFFKKALEELKVATHLSTVNDGDQLMDYLSLNSEHLPSVIFLDINMPRKNGLECLSEIKQNERLKNLPVVMFSSSNSRDQISKLFKTGANVYIHKPSDFAHLIQVIHHALPIATEKIVENNQVKYILNW